MRIILSPFHNPFANLALETVLFHRRRPSETLLFLYFNAPCVVIGRNQNPWAECNLQSGLPILRRRSGGGTVVHDLNNANFCVQMDKSKFSRTEHLAMVVRAFPQLHLTINERNDLVMEFLSGTGTPDNMSNMTTIHKKVSGSSYKLEKGGSYHHATLLLQSDLQRLRKALRLDPQKQGTVLKSGGTASVPSPVMNTGLSRDAFIDGISNEFQKMYGKAPIEIAEQSWFDSEEVQHEIAELSSWDWVYGKSPKFSLRTPHDETLEVEKGVVVNSSLLGSDLFGKRAPMGFQ